MKLKRLFIILILVVSLGILGFKLYIFPKYTVPILMYHHLDEKGKISSLSVHPEDFRRQMHFLYLHNHRVLSLSELVQAIKNKERLPHNCVVITFDDGHEDNFTSAYPVLQKYGFPATIFVIVDAIGKEGYLDDVQIQQMLSSSLIDIGSHSLSHDYLPGKDITELEREIGTSKEILETKFRKKIDFFCYPNGHFTFEIQEMVKKYGYKAACTTNCGKTQTYLNDDIFALKRIKIKDGFANLFVFRVKVSGYYNLFRRVRKPSWID